MATPSSIEIDVHSIYPGLDKSNMAQMKKLWKTGQ